MAAVVAAPLYGVDQDQPPIYGFLPYGKYDRTGRWVVTTPCQPSIIAVQDPAGRVYYMYENPPGAQIAEKNVSRGIYRTTRDAIYTVERGAERAVRDIGNEVSRAVRSWFK
jgi:hypothetical protein